MNKELKIGLVAGGVIVLLFALLFGLNHYNYQKSLIRETERNLTEDERKIYEDRLVLADTELAKEDLTTESRFDLLMYKGFQLYGLGQLESAVNYYTQATKILPENVNAYVAIHTAQLDMNDIRGAQKSIRKALELSPTDPDIWKRYIVLEKERFNAGDEQINNLYIDALRETQGHVDIITSYAVFLESTEKFQASIEYWQQAQTLNPEAHGLYQGEIDQLNTKLTP